MRDLECLDAIAERHGVRDWRRLHDHADNAELKRRRPNPHLLHPVDRVQIPERTERDVECASGAEHRFVLTAPPRRVLRLALIGPDGRRRARCAYEIELDGDVRRGCTDGDGLLELPIEPSTETARLRAGGDEWVLEIGQLNPLEDTADGGVSGAQARLCNLGYDPGEPTGRLDERTRAALAAFQRDRGLHETGECDADTRRALADTHGC